MEKFGDGKKYLGASQNELNELVLLLGKLLNPWLYFPKKKSWIKSHVYRRAFPSNLIISQKKSEKGRKISAPPLFFGAPENENKSWWFSTEEEYVGKNSWVLRKWDKWAK